MLKARGLGYIGFQGLERLRDGRGLAEGRIRLEEGIEGTEKHREKIMG